MRRYKNDGPRHSKDKQRQGLTVEVRNNDINWALRKFKKKVQDSGLIQEVRERQAYVKPSEKRAKQKAAGIARWKKKQRQNQDKGY